MRMIKFRAFHQDDNVMIYDLNTPSLFHGVLQPDDYVLMQFTGLVDQVGKEIYEDDILAIGDIKGKVFFHDGMYKLKRGKELNPYSLPLYNLVSLGEVIGNVHENAELLESK